MSMEVVDFGLQTAVKSGVSYGYLNAGEGFNGERDALLGTLMARAQVPQASTDLIDAHEEAAKVYKESVSILATTGLERAIEVLKLYDNTEKLDDGDVDFIHDKIARRVLSQEAELRMGAIDEEYFKAAGEYIKAASLPFFKRKLAQRKFGRNGYQYPGYLLASQHVWEKGAANKTNPGHMHATDAIRLFEDNNGTVQEGIVTTLNTQIKDEFAIVHVAFRTLNESRLLGLNLAARGIRYE